MILNSKDTLSEYPRIWLLEIPIDQTINTDTAGMSAKILLGVITKFLKFRENDWYRASNFN